MDSRRRGAIQIVAGLLLTAAGVVATSELYASKQTVFVAAYLVAQIAMVVAVRGIYELLSAEAKIPPQGSNMPTFGYKSFVAWRYLLVPQPRVLAFTKRIIGAALIARLACWLLVLLGVGGGAIDVRDPLWLAETLSTMFLVAVVFWGVLRHSKPATYVFVFSVLVVLACIVATWVLTKRPASFIEAPDEHRVLALQIISVTMNIFGALAGIAMFFGILRAFFSFFTTVPIGGVWIGTAALVCVLSVMSGFETDLREKILGSNAHIQITREDGEFTEWRDIKARVDKTPGVVASTPFAVSEVVIAAHNNGMNVIIKGIDPKTVGKVTDLVSDLEDKEAMQRLDPLIDESQHLTVPQQAKPTACRRSAARRHADGWGPDRLLRTEPDAAGSAAAAPHDDRDLDVEPPEAGSAYGGDATQIVQATDAPAVIDPPPADLITSDEPPLDFSGTTDITELPIDAIDVPERHRCRSARRRCPACSSAASSSSRRTSTRARRSAWSRRSPIPSNPDATGTPIPFNRDYRVAGIFYTGMYEYDLKYVYVSLDSLQDVPRSRRHGRWHRGPDRRRRRHRGS